MAAVLIMALVSIAYGILMWNWYLGAMLFCTWYYMWRFWREN